MLKSQFLSGVRPFFAPDDDRRAAAQAERDKIKVETTKKVEPEKVEVKVEEKNDDQKDDKTDDDESDEEGKDDSEEGDEEDDEKEEAKELTAEEYKKQVDALTKTVNRLQRRTGKTASERDKLKKDLAAATSQLNAKVAEGDAVLTEDEVERRANLKAEEKTNDREFKKAVDTLTKAATKIDKDFMVKVNEMAADVAPIPQFMIAALEDLDNGGAVLAHLANNPEEYEEIFDLAPAKMTMRLSKLSSKIEEEGKPKIKKISKVPAPIETIKGSDKSPTQLPANPTKNMAEFVEQRNRQVAERRKAKYG